MTASALQERLRSGRDPNDASWIIARYWKDWNGAKATGLTYDADAGALRLAGLARPEMAGSWASTAAVAGPDGTLFRSDPARHLLLARRPCDPDFAPVAGVGGFGFATGRFNRPLGVAVDGAGRVFVADSNAGRVQVVLPGESAVQAVLTEGLERPVSLAFDMFGNLLVSDAGTGAIHVFSARFKAVAVLQPAALDPWTREPWTGPAQPLGVAALEDGSIAAFDPARPALWHMTADGAALPAVPWPAADSLPPGWRPMLQQFAGAGEIVLGPFDGGTHNLAWHRIHLDADIPKGASVSVQTFASNVPDEACLRWAPRRPLPAPQPALDGGRIERLVQSEPGAWGLWRLGPLLRDRPVVCTFRGSPNELPAPSQVSVPADAARMLRAGDMLVLRAPDGSDVYESRIEALSRVQAEAAAWGAKEALAAPVSAMLVRRHGGDMAFGPVNLSAFMPLASLALPGLDPDGVPDQVELPHEAACFLLAGDVIQVAGKRNVGGREVDVEGVIEIIGVEQAPRVTITLRDPLPGAPASGAELILDSAPDRLIVNEPIPTLAEMPPGSIAKLVAKAGNVVERHVAWVDGPSRTVWLVPDIGPDNASMTWERVEFAEPRATDRGRYLWLRIRLRGGGQEGAPLGPAASTPSLRAVRVTAPRPSLLAWMPLVFQQRDRREDPPGALFLERFLTLFEGRLTEFEEAYESVSRLLNPAAADEGWLTFVAGWLDLAFDPSWPEEARRRLVIEGADLQAMRGTRESMKRFLEIYTGAPAAVVENFRMRPPRPVQLGARGALGVAPLGGPAGAVDIHAHRFSVSVRLPPGRDRSAARSAVARILDIMKPAHTLAVLDTNGSRAPRIGFDTVVGATVIPELGDPCACDPDDDSGTPQPGRVPGGFRLGGRLAADRAPTSACGGA